MTPNSLRQHDYTDTTSYYSWPRPTAPRPRRVNFFGKVIEMIDLRSINARILALRRASTAAVAVSRLRPGSPCAPPLRAGRQPRRRSRVGPTRTPRALTPVRNPGPAAEAIPVASSPARADGIAAAAATDRVVPRPTSSTSGSDSVTARRPPAATRALNPCGSSSQRFSTDDRPGPTDAPTAACARADRSPTGKTRTSSPRPEGEVRDPDPSAKQPPRTPKQPQTAADSRPGAKTARNREETAGMSLPSGLS